MFTAILKRLLKIFKSITGFIIRYILCSILVVSALYYSPIENLGETIRKEVVESGEDDKSDEEFVYIWRVDESVMTEKQDHDLLPPKYIQRMESQDALIIGLYLPDQISKEEVEMIMEALGQYEQNFVISAPFDILNKLDPKISNNYENIILSYSDLEIKKIDDNIRSLEIAKDIEEKGCVLNFGLSLWQHFLEDAKYDFTCNEDEVNFNHPKITINKEIEFEKEVLEAKDGNGYKIIDSEELMSISLDESILIIDMSFEDDLEEKASIYSSVLPIAFESHISKIVTIILGLILTFILLFLGDLTSAIWYNILIFILFNAGNYAGAKNFTDEEIAWPFTQIAIVIFITFTFSLFWKFINERRKKNFLEDAFKQYVNKDLLKELKNNPKQMNLGGEQRSMSVLFSDIRGFTSISEGLKPKALIDLINDYLDIMTNVVFKRDGTIDKYIGDAIMAFWNAPVRDKYYATKSIITSLLMVKKLKKLRTSDKRFTDLNIGIGINTGEVVVGNVGSRYRFDYTVLGDNVNLASRLEGLTKKYGVNVIISESTYKRYKEENKLHLNKPRIKMKIKMKNKLQNKLKLLSKTSPQGDNHIKTKLQEKIVWFNKKIKKLDPELSTIIFRKLDTTIVKGKHIPIDIYQPMPKTKRNLRIKKLYDKGFKLYEKQNWDKATSIFRKTAKVDKTSTMMIDRIKQIKEDKNWKGVWEWTEK